MPSCYCWRRFKFHFAFVYVEWIKIECLRHFGKFVPKFNWVNRYSMERSVKSALYQIQPSHFSYMTERNWQRMNSEQWTVNTHHQSLLRWKTRLTAIRCDWLYERNCIEIYWNWFKRKKQCERESSGDWRSMEWERVCTMRNCWHKYHLSARFRGGSHLRLVVNTM